MTPLLAATCGNAVATWDYTAASTSTTDAADPSTAHSFKVDPTIIGKTANDTVDIFSPHGPTNSTVVSSLCWNHNDQVLATCSSSSSVHDEAPNVALTHAASGATLETFSNFLPNSNAPPAAATSLGFGGKSRYLVVGDASGCASVWDLKKTARVRTFRLPQPPGGSGGGSAGSVSSRRMAIPLHVQGCTAARIDPTDTFVAAASGWETDGAVRLYKLREGKLAATLRDIDTDSNEWDGHGGVSVGAIDFSPLDSSRVAVGTRDGTLLLWDMQAATSSAAKASPSRRKAVPPTLRLTRRHDDAVTGIAFSPVNKVLLSSCSADGSVSFHDVNMLRTIQSFRPGSELGQRSVRSTSMSSGMMSVSFASDGVTCAAGSINGHVYLYDLRKAGLVSRMEFESSVNVAPVEAPVLNVKFACHSRTNGHTIRAAPVGLEQKEVASVTEVSTSVPERAALIDAAPNPDTHTKPAVSTSSTADKILPSRFEAAPTSDVSESAVSSKTGKRSHISDDDGAVEEDFTKADVTPGTEEFQDTARDKGQDNGSVEAVEESFLTEKSLESTLLAARSSKPVLSTRRAPPNVATTEGDDTSATDILASEHNRYSSAEDPDLLVNKLVLKRMIQDEIDDLREHMEGALRNMHLDMLRQFQQQSNEMHGLFAKQSETIGILVEQNRQLREENERLQLPMYEY
mmetsp:Transcript_22832/g.47430  ORF Transcript_22832/g.47430 Transcript_22832/m.47430 type:complete len:687 (-) Transcript_22832:1291-3351(-)